MKQLQTLKRWLTCAPMLATVALLAPQTAFADNVPLKLNYEGTDKNNVEITETAENEYSVNVVGGDPFCATFPLEAALTEDYKYIVFEYTSAQEITNEMEFFFSPWRGGYSINFGGLPLTSEWSERAVDVTSALATDWGFGTEGSTVRFDFGNISSGSIQIRNLRVTNENPFATSMEQVDGIYQITNGNDLAEFSTLVNKGMNNASAALTADIDMKDITMAPIGNLASLYCGTFDGQGHTISNLVINKPEVDHVGLVGAVTGGAVVKNVILDETCEITGRSFVGLVGTAFNGGTITIDHVGNEGNVTATPNGGQYGVNAGGIIGVNMGGACTFQISNCYVTGNITGRIESAAISGWADGGTITNCWTVANVAGVDGENVFVRGGSVTINNCYETNGKNNCGTISAEDLTSGRLCYLLNGNQTNIAYTQTLGEGGDAMPCLFGDHKQVFLNCPDGLRCDGSALSDKTAYTNEAQAIPEHTHVDGICEVCGHVDANAYELVDGAYEISTPAQLYWFALVNNTIDNTISARLTADIDFTAYNISIGIGYHDFCGTFDGQGHKVTIKREKTDGTENCALFDCLKGTVKNLWIDGTITSNGKYAAGVAAHTYDSAARIENVVSTVTIESSLQGDATNAGILAVADEGAAIVNCVFAGKLTTTNNTECCGGIVGWATKTVNITNTLMIGDIEVNPNDTHTISRNFGNAQLTNTWVKNYFGSSQEGQLLGENAVASGEAAYKVGMGQQIGTDAIPTPWNAARVNYLCGQYTNKDVPALSTVGAPKLYYIKNTRTGKYVSYNPNGNQTQSEEPQDYASMYYLIATGESEGKFQPVSIHNVAAGEKSMTDFGEWGTTDYSWYLLMDPDMTNDGFYIGKNKNTGENAWWNDWSGNEVGSWSCDGGSIFAFEVVPAEDCPEFATITYNQIMNGKTMKVQQSTMMIGAAMPTLVAPAYVEAETPAGVVEGDATYDLNVTVNTPFEASESFENAKWYEVINTHNTHKYIKYDGEEAEVYKMTNESDLSDKYLWSFYGNPYEGYTVMNYAAGDGKYLHVSEAANGQTPVMSEEATVWTIGKKDAETFGFGINGEWWNRSGGDGGEDLALWQSGPTSDLGSTLKVAPVDMAKRYVITDASDNVIATRENLVLVSSMNAIKLNTGVRNAVVDESKKITIYDYFAGEEIEGTVTVDKGIINIALARPVAASKLIYVTVPAEYVTMNDEITNESEVTLTYYVHGSDNIEESVIERIMAIVKDGATGIEGINGADTHYNVVSLSGAQVRNGNSLKGLKGLYIVNGKKVILK